MISFSNYIFLSESSTSKCVISFGRMNPPHIGHLKLLNKIAQLAKENKCNGLLYVSHSTGDLRNPLNYDEKCNYINKILPRGVKLVKSTARKLSEVLLELSKFGYKDIIMVVGSDRLKDFEWVHRYLKDYNINSFKLVSSGERDEDSEDSTTKASASLMRKLAIENDFNLFKRYSPFDIRTTKQMFDKLRLVLT